MKKLILIISLSVMCLATTHEIKPKESKIDGSSIYIYEFVASDGRKCIVATKKGAVAIMCFKVGD